MISNIHYKRKGIEAAQVKQQTRQVKETYLVLFRHAVGLPVISPLLLQPHVVRSLFFFGQSLHTQQNGTSVKKKKGGKLVLGLSYIVQQSTYKELKAIKLQQEADRRTEQI